LQQEGYPLRRQEIISRAAKLFQENGYERTSVNQIAKEMGFSKPALYYYFSDKKEILWEIYNIAISRALKEARSIVEQDMTGKEKMRLMLMTHTMLLSEDIYLWSVMFDEENSLAEDKQKLIRKNRGEYEAIFEKVYSEGVKAGDFRSCPPKIAIRAILGSFNWLYKWYQPDCAMSPKEIFEHFYDILANGFIGPAQNNIRGDNY